MEINAALKRIVETGKIDFGSEKTVKNILAGKAKLVIIASNCPKKIKDDLENYVKIENVPLVKYPGTALQLGEVCGKPFVIAALSVTDMGSVQLGDLKA